MLTLRCLQDFFIELNILETLCISMRKKGEIDTDGIGKKGSSITKNIS